MADVSDLTIQGSKFKEWSLIEGICNVRYQQQLVENHTITGQKKLMLSVTYRRKRLVVACRGQSLESEPNAYEPKNIWNSIINFLDAFYRFSRPHTIIGTVKFSKKLSDFSPMFFTGMLEAIIAALIMNIYIVGLNKISDIEIDKVNKPYLPLASGEYSTGTGIFIVTSFAILSFWLWSVVGHGPYSRLFLSALCLVQHIP
uniref:Uncharacterized protein n=1 Tax=Chenopodium quinoa TaxID=63459 RepID=A0A803LSD8_CHEQI